MFHDHEVATVHLKKTSEIFISGGYWGGCEVEKRGCGWSRKGKEKMRERGRNKMVSGTPK